MGKFKNVVITTKGTFKEKQKEAEEGFEVEPWEMERGGKTVTGVTYAKYHKNLRGKITKIELVTPPYENASEELRIIIEENENSVYNLTIPYLNNKREWLGDWVVAIAPVLNALKKGMNIETWLNANKRDDSDRLYKNIFFKNTDTDEMIKPTFQREDVPSWDSEEVIHPVTKAKTVKWTRIANNQFLVEKIEEALDNFNNTSPAEAVVSEKEKPVSEKKEKPVSNKKAVVVEEDEDDLPFG